MLYKGVRNTESYGALRTYDYDERIHTIDMDKAPLTVLLQKTRKVTCTDPRFDWFIKERIPNIITLTEDADTDPVLTAALTDSKIIQAGYILRAIYSNATTPVFDGEIMRVISVNDITGDITVQRQYSDTSPVSTTLKIGAVLKVLGPAYADGVGTGVMIDRSTDNLFGLCEIIKTPFHVTRTENKMNLRGGKLQAIRRAENSVTHEEMINQKIWFSARNLQTDSVSGEIIRVMGGLLFYQALDAGALKTNIGGALGPTNWATWLKNAFTVTNDKVSPQLLFAGSTLIDTLEKLMLDKGVINLKPNDNKWGLTAQEFSCSWGKVILVWEPAFIGPFAGMGVMLTMDNLELQSYDKTQLMVDIGAKDIDKTTDQYLSHLGIKPIVPRKIKIIHGVTGYSSAA